MAYHLDLTLQQRATLSIAISVWNSQEVKDKISKWSDKFRETKFFLIKTDEWQQLINEVLEEINPNVLPSLLIGELIHVVKELGRKMFNWYQYILSECRGIRGMQDDVTEYMSEIYWTHIGTVDISKVLRIFWMKNRKFNFDAKFHIACKNALEDEIHDLKREIPFFTSYDLNMRYLIPPHKRRYGESTYEHLTPLFWKYFSSECVGHYFIQYAVRDQHLVDRYGIVSYNENFSAEHNMFLLSVYDGYSTAAKYFWNKLTQEEKDSSILDSAYVAVDRGSVANELNDTWGHRAEMSVEMLMFLINKMTMNQRKSFFSDERMLNEQCDDGDAIKRDLRVKILFMLLYIWPWQELFIPVLKDMWQYLEHHDKSVLMILFIISKKIVEPSDAAENGKFQIMLRQVWRIIPGSMKRTMIQNDSDFYLSFNFIVNLLIVGDLNSIKMIFNDPEIADVRMQYIEFVQEGYKLLIMFNEFKILEQFMEEVLRSEEERIHLKSKVDGFDVCAYLLHTRDYDSADKFLNWKFETEEERKQCKNHFKMEFSVDWVYDVLLSNNGSVDEARKETSEYLKWMLESEDEIVKFKKAFLFNSKSLNKNKYYSRSLSKKEAHQIRQILAPEF